MNIGDGRRIKIKFTQPLIGDVTGRDTPLGYKYKKIYLGNAQFSSKNVYNVSYPPANAFDGNETTYWWGSSGVNWLKVQLAEPKVLTKIRLRTGYYYFKTFTISGSNDDKEWFQIGDTLSGSSSTTSAWYDYELNNDVAYLYYKIDTSSPYQSSYVEIREWELYETVRVGNEEKFTVSFDEYNYLPGGITSRQTRTVDIIEKSEMYAKKLNLENGTFQDVCISESKIKLEFKEVTENG